MIKVMFSTVFVLAAIFTKAQTINSIWVVDLVKVKNGNHAEALYYFEHNWKLFREKALEKGHIRSYQLLTGLQPGDFDIMLATEYADSTMLHNSEANFAPILKEIRPNGPVFMNEKKRNDILEIVGSQELRTTFSATKKSRKKHKK